MPDDPLDDVPASFKPDPEVHARLKRSMRFELADLQYCGDGYFNRATSIGEGFSIGTAGGDTLTLDDLFQCRTYGGRLNGIPHFSERRFENAADYAAIICPKHAAPPCMVPPRMHRGQRKYTRVAHRLTALGPARASLVLLN